MGGKCTLQGGQVPIYTGGQVRALKVQAPAVGGRCPIEGVSCVFSGALDSKDYHVLAGYSVEILESFGRF